MSIKSIICITASICLLWGCGKRVPKDVIQPQDMENLLYDYHLANAMRADLPYDQAYKKDAYVAYVLEKHGVTRAEFDSSMVWYTRHTAYLEDIYKHLNDRYTQVESQLKRGLMSKRQQLAVSISGDTVDLWQDRTIYLLSHSSLTDKITFELKADTSFHVNDALELNANFRLLGANRNTFTAVMGLNIQFENDSVVGTTMTVNDNGMRSLYLNADSAYKFKAVNGFIYFLKNSGFTNDMLLLTDLKLNRYHRKITPTSAAENLSEKSDSLVKSDSISDDTVRNRLSKREMRGGGNTVK